MNVQLQRHLLLPQTLQEIYPGHERANLRRDLRYPQFATFDAAFPYALHLPGIIAVARTLID